MTAPSDGSSFDALPEIHAIATYGRDAGSARVRLFDWLDHLGIVADEVTFTSGSSVSPRRLMREPFASLRAERRVRLIARSALTNAFISRRATPFGGGRTEARILSTATHGVYDFDDALWLSRRSASRMAEVWRRSVEAADIVIAGNEYLASEARKHTGRVIVIPSCVQPDSYQKKSDYSFENPTAVWIGSPSTEKYLQDIAEPLLQLHDETGLRLRVISGPPRELGALDVMVNRVQWTRDSFAAELAKSDFGIMPLDDAPWSRGKCAYKLLQYGATGLPTVGSPVGANIRALERIGGGAATTLDEWFAEGRRLIESTSTDRERLGAQARRAVEEHYSFDAWAETWLEAAFGAHQ